MTFRRRVFTLYRNDVVYILRDLRTLIALIVVPLTSAVLMVPNAVRVTP